MSSFLLLQLCPTCFVRLTWMVCQMWGKWPYSCCFVGCCFQDLFTQLTAFWWSSYLAFFSTRFVSVRLVHPYKSMDTRTTWKKSCFNLWNWLDFHMIDNPSIAFYTFPKHMLTSFSVDVMLMPRYVNWSSNFRGLPLWDGSVLFKTYVLCFIGIYLLFTLLYWHSCRS